MRAGQPTMIETVPCRAPLGRSSSLVLLARIDHHPSSSCSTSTARRPSAVARAAAHGGCNYSGTPPHRTPLKSIRFSMKPITFSMDSTTFTVKSTIYGMKSIVCLPGCGVFDAR